MTWGSAIGPCFAGLLPNHTWTGHKIETNISRFGPIRKFKFNLSRAVLFWCCVPKTAIPVFNEYSRNSRLLLLVCKIYWIVRNWSLQLSDSWAEQMIHSYLSHDSFGNTACCSLPAPKPWAHIRIGFASVSFPPICNTAASTSLCILRFFFLTTQFQGKYSDEDYITSEVRRVETRSTKSSVRKRCYTLAFYLAIFQDCKKWPWSLVSA